MTCQDTTLYTPHWPGLRIELQVVVGKKGSGQLAMNPFLTSKAGFGMCMKGEMGKAGWLEIFLFVAAPTDVFRHHWYQTFCFFQKNKSYAHANLTVCLQGRKVCKSACSLLY